MTKSVSPKKKINNGAFFQEQGLVSFIVAYNKGSSVFLEVFYDFLFNMGVGQAQLVDLMMNQTEIAFQNKGKYDDFRDDVFKLNLGHATKQQAFINCGLFETWMASIIDGIQINTQGLE